VPARRFRDPTIILTLVALVALPALAWLQARWLDDVGVMARERLDRVAQNAASGVARDLEFEFARAMPWMSGPPTTGPADGNAGISAADTFIVDAPAGGQGLRFRAWNVADATCQVREWPPELDAWRQRAAQHYAAEPRPRITELASALDGLTPSHVVFAIPLAGGTASPPTAPPPCDAERDALLLLRVSLASIRASLLPRLIERHFGDAASSDFNVAVVTRSQPTTVIAASAGTFDVSRLVAAPDAQAPLYILRADEPGTRDPRDGALRRDDHHDRTEADEQRLLDRKAPWMLVAQHRLGSLDIAVGRVRRRNLALAAGVLVVLAGAIVALGVSTRRAARLSRQHVEFVAAVSHELRSPVAAIDVAAQNIVAGVVTDPVKLKRYGEAIGLEARRLGATVERVLQFASISGKHASMARTPVSMRAVVDAVMARATRHFPAASFVVANDLPESATVVGDRASLESCVENLVANAAKHGGPATEVRVRASLAGDRAEAVVRVEDDGPGIGSMDAAHLFEPFYRGAEAVERCIPGNGLGLYVVKHLVESHGGRVGVDRSRSTGAAFTIWLPLADGNTVVPDQHGGSA